MDESIILFYQACRMYEDIIIYNGYNIAKQGEQRQISHKINPHKIKQN